MKRTFEVKSKSLHRSFVVLHLSKVHLFAVTLHLNNFLERLRLQTNR